MYDHDEWCPPVDEMDDFSYKMKELIDAEIDLRIGEVVKNLHNSKELNAKLYKENRELRNLLHINGHAKDNILREAMKEARREIFGGFYPGDTVYYPDYKYDRTTCATCNGKKKVTADVNGVDHTFDCPTCDGYGSKSKSYYVSSKEDRIETITLEFNRDKKAKHHRFYLQRKDSSVEQEKIFKTVEECQAWCEAKNKELEEQEAKKKCK
ncbi:hypothetical protein ACFPES_03060 [Paenibacillus sp. GCM10023248]|uniref:hypothetical protein n=1 Tax=unclassified Paenibacillus TaxID=185978 RepID=UPI002378DFAC|nr:hypothetical protein [Paenibacillus sp. MAHUQ-63]MDD9266004.1 hypothetical protein [Paenibacillus sp. MAHUQ-63]